MWPRWWPPGADGPILAPIRSLPSAGLISTAKAADGKRLVGWRAVGVQEWLGIGLRRLTAKWTRWTGIAG